MSVPTKTPNRAYTGDATPTYLITFGIGSGTGSFTVNNAGDWIDVKTGIQVTSNATSTDNRLIIAVGIGTTHEEKMLVTVSNNTINVIQRALDGGSPYDWSNLTLSNVVVAPAWSAVEAYEANKAAVSCTNLNGGGTNPTPAQVSVNVGQVGISNYAAAADHAHQMPSTLVTNIVTDLYIQNAITPTYIKTTGGIDSAYINTTLTDSGVRTHVPYSYIQSVSPTVPAGVSYPGSTSTVVPLTTTAATLVGASVAKSGYTSYLVIVKAFQQSTASAALTVQFELTGVGTASGYNNLLAGYIGSTTTIGATFVATTVVSGLTAATTYTFGATGKTTTGTINVVAPTITVVGLS